MSGSGYTWGGADGGSWEIASNWKQGTTVAMQAPGSIDLAEFVSFTGTVVGAISAQILDVGPGSSLTLGGNGFVNNIVVGQDFNFNVGPATLAIESGAVISSGLLNLGSVGGSGGTLVANGTFSTTGGITLGAPGFAAAIQVDAAGAVLDSASNLTMDNGGSIAIASGGELVLGANGVAGALSIDGNHIFSGVGTITGNVVDNGQLETANFGNSPTVLSISGNVTGGGLLTAVQELDIGGAIGSGVTVSLTGNGGTNAGLLRLALPLGDAGTLATMSTHSTLALAGLNFDNVVWSPGSLTVTGADGTLTLATSGDFSHQTFVALPDSVVSGTDIITVACFAEGTRLATPRGQIAVEELRVGDWLLTREGTAEPVVSIRHRLLDRANHPRPETVQPVLVCTGAFGVNRPERDLYLSPDHAVFVNDVLVPVKLLINGGSIRWIERSSIQYFHVELPRHAVILAEGLTVESYFNLADRANFRDDTEAVRLFPECAPRPASAVPGMWETLGAAPLVMAGAALEAARKAAWQGQTGRAAR
jgi:collagen type I alpha